MGTGGYGEVKNLKIIILIWSVVNEMIEYRYA